MDLAISNWMFDTFGSSKAFAIVSRIITELGCKWAIMTAVAVLLIFKKTRKLGVYAMFACGLAFCINNIILKNVIERARPFVENPELAQMSALASYELPDGYSMASGHSTASMALAVTVMLFHKKWGFLTIPYALLVGLSRICLCVHYLTDVLVGFAIGAALAVGIYFLLNYLLKVYLKKKENKNEENNLSDKEPA